MNIKDFKFILGTAQFGKPYGTSFNKKKKLNNKIINNILKICKSRISILDTAEDYNLNILTKKKFNNFIVNTKIDIDLFRKSEKQIINYFRKVVKFYNIDVLFVRNLENEYKNVKIFNIIKNLKNLKFIRRLGISVYSFENIKKLYKNISYDVIQLPSNIFDNRSDNYKNFFKEKCIEVQARSVFLQGAIFLKKDSLNFKSSFKNTELNKFINFCQKKSLNKYDVALSHVFNKKYIDKIIVGVHNKDQLNHILKFKQNKNTQFLKKFSSNNPKLIDPRKWK